MKYKIEYLENSKTAYMRNIGPYGSIDNFKMMTEFKKWIGRNNIKSNGVYGVALDSPEMTQSEKCRYDVMIFITEFNFQPNVSIN